MAVFVLYAFQPPAAVTVAVVVILAILTFLPVNFVHPVRVVKWRGPTLLVLALWLASGAWLLAAGFQAPAFVRFVLLAATIYLLSVAAVQQAMRAD